MKISMKSLISLVLTGGMFFTSSNLIYGENVENGEYSTDVKASYIESTDSETVYSVDLVWGAMEFTYNSPYKGVWDPESHTYKNSKEGYWEYNNSNSIQISNHSNTAIKCKLTSNLDRDLFSRYTSIMFNEKDVNYGAVYPCNINIESGENYSDPNDVIPVTRYARIPEESHLNENTSNELIILGSINIEIE